jgi:hypothetical protein
LSFFKRLATGLGTLIGVLVETTQSMFTEIRNSYEAYRRQGGPTEQAAVALATQKKLRLREVNDEIMYLRNRRMGRGGYSAQDSRRWDVLQQERSELLGDVHRTKEVRAAEKFLSSEADIEKIEVDDETSHILQYNAFADILGKKCRCGRPMKIQWKRDLGVCKQNDFYWGCTGYYDKTCFNTEPLQRNDFGLMTNTSEPEHKLSAGDFGIILSDPGTQSIIETRIEDLKSDLSSKHTGVELSTCPVHGENMVLRRKSKPQGLLDTYFLACPLWQPNDAGCSFIEKLKSGPQLAALLKSETGQGIL